MSGTGAQLVPQPRNDSLPENRSPLAHLLHALNQPLTGLQCSLELAVAGPRSAEQYLRTLRESLELTQRMRILVEAIRELAEPQKEDAKPSDTFLLDALLRETANDLRPVAETRKVDMRIASEVPLLVRSSRRHLATLLFRFLESSLSLSHDGSEFRVAAERERDQAVLRVLWRAAPPSEHSPFSRAELGLVIAQAEWERAGAVWTHTQTGDTRTCTIRLPLAASPACPTRVEGERLK
jgi:signal transduction histidine kinase